jgi:hypothetical protein
MRWNQVRATVASGGWISLLGMGAVHGTLEAQFVRPTLLEHTGSFAAPSLTESSGVAVSRRLEGVLWTHNDSGDHAYLYATNLAGDDLGSYHVSGASAVDWEDIALGPCPEAETCLYIADTGDNRRRRSNHAVYILPEPSRLPRPGQSPPEALEARRLGVSYEGGPRDVEAMAVDSSGAILFISKGRSGPFRLFRISAAAARGDSAEAEFLGNLDIVPQHMLGRWVTGAAVSPSGRQLVVRTYTELYFLGWNGHEAVLNRPPCLIGAVEPQGEAVDFLDEDTLVLTSESRGSMPGLITRVQCPSSAAESGT